jgi:hypothetical protein
MILATSLVIVTFSDDKNKNKKVKIAYYIHPSFFFQLRCVQIKTKINSEDFLFNTEKEEFFFGMMIHHVVVETKKKSNS